MRDKFQGANGGVNTHMVKTFIPSTQSLQGFQAAARFLSFTRAADELGLTQTAISHQIKVLEDQLGTKLFVREKNRLILTPAAESYLRDVNQALEQLALASENLRRGTTKVTLTVACLPTYAVKCLIPHLRDFQDEFPHIIVKLSTVSNFDDFGKDQFDVVIRYGSGRWAGMRADLLHEEEYFPVCSPELLEDIKTGEAITESISRWTRIRTYYSSHYEDDWPAWLNAAGYEDLRFSTESIFHLQLTSLAAAIEGGGVAIGRTPLVNIDLSKCKLVEPFNLRVKSSSNYYVVSTLRKSELEKVEKFREWTLNRLRLLVPRV